MLTRQSLMYSPAAAGEVIEKALNAPNTVVISESAMTVPCGQTIETNDNMDPLPGAVMKDNTTHFHSLLFS